MKNKKIRVKEAIRKNASLTSVALNIPNSRELTKALRYLTEETKVSPETARAALLLAARQLSGISQQASRSEYYIPMLISQAKGIVSAYHRGRGRCLWDGVLIAPEAMIILKLKDLLNESKESKKPGH